MVRTLPSQLIRGDPAEFAIHQRKQPLKSVGVPCRPPQQQGGDVSGGGRHSLADESLLSRATEEGLEAGMCMQPRVPGFHSHIGDGVRSFSVRPFHPVERGFVVTQGSV